MFRAGTVRGRFPAVSSVKACSISELLGVFKYGASDAPPLDSLELPLRDFRCLGRTFKFDLVPPAGGSTRLRAERDEPQAAFAFDLQHRRVVGFEPIDRRLERRD